MSSTLPTSRLHTFIDSAHDQAVHFLEGQKLVEDLALARAYPPETLSWLRTAVLSVLPMISFLKRDEELGFYIDATDPKFLVKIETRFDGTIRAMHAGSVPPGTPATSRVRGVCRVVKFSPGEATPYSSIVDFTRATIDEIVNDTLRRSFQFSSRVVIARESDQSLMLSRLPALDASRHESRKAPERDNRRGLEPDEYFSARIADFTGIIERGLTGEDEIIAAFAALGLKHLASRDVVFRCSCSRDRFVATLRSLVATGQDPFDGDPSIEAVCDYCGTRHEISREDVTAPAQDGHPAH